MMLQRAIESKFLFMMIEITLVNEGGGAGVCGAPAAAVVLYTARYEKEGN
jgi:hypothetical protein